MKRSRVSFLFQSDSSFDQGVPPYKVLLIKVQNLISAPSACFHPLLLAITSVAEHTLLVKTQFSELRFAGSFSTKASVKCSAAIRTEAQRFSRQIRWRLPCLRHELSAGWLFNENSGGCRRKLCKQILSNFFCFRSTFPIIAHHSRDQ